MTKFSYTIKDEVGIHARPAGLLVKEAKKYKSEINIECNGKKSVATKLISVMGLGAKCGDVITVTVDGSDEEEAFNALKIFFETNL